MGKLTWVSVALIVHTRTWRCGQTYIGKDERGQVTILHRQSQLDPNYYLCRADP